MDNFAKEVSTKYIKDANIAMMMFENENWAAKKKLIGNSGTNNQVNDTDCMGDGDQSSLRKFKHAQVHRDIWSAGGDTSDLISCNAMPPFVMACMFGRVELVAEFLEKASNQAEKEQLLETRYGILRLTPLILTVIGHKTLSIRDKKVSRRPVEVVRVLIQHGVRVDARDLCGKTVIHYTCGPLCDVGDNTALSVADLCIARATELAISPPLVDVQDRTGAVPLQQAVMLNREDLVSFLCSKHGANASIADNDGCSPTSIAVPGTTIFGLIRNIINKNAAKQFKCTCLVCGGGSDEVNILVCSGCKIAKYCSRECQKLHWKQEHKKVCALSNGVGFTVHIDSTNIQTIGNFRGSVVVRGKTWDGLSPPAGVAMGEYFDVKIQCGFSPETPMVLYPKEKTPELHITTENCPTVKELFDTIRAFKPCDGRKAYFRAKLVRAGELFVSSEQIFVRKW